VEIRNETLRIFGTHGEGEKVILTVRLFGQDLELVKEPAQAFDLRPALDDARRRLAELLRQPLEALERQAGPPPTPAGQPE
jgi:hypothetical protein